MSDSTSMPSAPTEEAVREWLLSRPDVSFVGTGADELARAFLKWAEAKVREAARMTKVCAVFGESCDLDAIVARVMGREVRRG